MKKNNSIKHINKAISYLRLSEDDDDKLESNSISNQRLINQNHAEGLSIEIVAEKVDDGYTGTNFDRPGFQEMLELLRQGVANCVIVKDLSRLGRDFTGVLNFVQRIFPEMGVRFISVMDPYDSESEISQNDYLSLPIKSLINESYPANTSISIRGTLNSMRKEGLFVAAFTYYGFKKDPENRHKIIIDPLAGEVVRDIFRLKLSGYSQDHIADYLEDKGILTPADYKVSQGINFKTPFKRYARSHWTAQAVGRILTNEIYIGVLIQGRTTTPNFKVKKIIEKSEDEMAIIHGKIPKLISPTDFMVVQHLMDKDMRTAPGSETVYLFAGILECASCRQNLVRKSVKQNGKEYIYYVCSTNKYDKNQCSPHRISERKLTKAIILLIQYHINMIVEMKTLLKYIENIPFADRQVQKDSMRLNMLKKDYQLNMKRSAKLYEDYQDGILTKEEFLTYKKRFRERCQELEKLIEEQKNESMDIFKKIRNQNEWINHLLQFQNIQELDRRTLVSLIKNIRVSQEGNIEVEFWFKDEYENLLQSIENINISLQDSVIETFLHTPEMEGGVLCG